MTYHNTVPLSGEVLKEKKKKISKQEEEILELFRRHKRFSPSQIYRRGFAGRAPITSVRRAITNLTQAGFLRKSGEKVPGMYNDSENVWEFVDNQLSLF